MMFTLFKRNHGGDEAEKVRYAKEVHEEARKKAIKILKQREGCWVLGVAEEED